jgi:hypothetical protein
MLILSQNMLGSQRKTIKIRLGDDSDTLNTNGTYFHLSILVRSN